MNYKKIIKDLKEQNNQLKNQYEYMQIRAVSGEFKQKRIDEALKWIELLRQRNQRIENKDVLFSDNIETIIKILKG